MSRAIKLRAWDEGKGVMHYDFQFIKSGDSDRDWIVFTSDKHPLTHEPHPFDDPFFHRQFHTMQFTGLQDKNGRDIYEGDIVKAWDWGRPPQKLLTVSKVHWDADDYGWGLNPDPTDGDRYDLFRNVEVIGNIHENPELLK